MFVRSQDIDVLCVQPNEIAQNAVEPIFLASLEDIDVLCVQPNEIAQNAVEPIFLASDGCTHKTSMSCGQIVFCFSCLQSVACDTVFCDWSIVPTVSFSRLFCREL